MPVGSRVHASDQADVIDDAGQMRQQLGDLSPALPVSPKSEWTPQQLLAGLIDETEFHIARIISP